MHQNTLIHILRTKTNVKIFKGQRMFAELYEEVHGTMRAKVCVLRIDSPIRRSHAIIFKAFGWLLLVCFHPMILLKPKEQANKAFSERPAKKAKLRK